MATITNSGEDVISRSEDITLESIADASSFDDGFEIRRTVDDILNGGYTKIGLQFPDELLHQSVGVYKALTRQLRERSASTSHKLYILADTSYNACCVDEVAAQHVDADVVVHYGHACLEPPARLPVIYVFGKRSIDIDTCIDTLSKAVVERVSSAPTPLKSALVCTDVAYAWKAQTVCDRLAQCLRGTIDSVDMQHVPPTVVYPAMDSGAPAPVRPGDETKMQDHEADGSALGGEGSEPRQQTTCCGEENSCCNGDSKDTKTCNASTCGDTQQTISIAQRSVSSTTPQPHISPDTLLIYIGPSSLKLTNLVLTNKDVVTLAYDPEAQKAFEATGTENRLLQRRYAQVNKARDCDVFGLAVGTLSTASYLPLVRKLRTKLQQHSKKVYTVAVGKLNPAKLGNFAEIQAWCVIACGENSIVNSKEFHVPVITPFELEMALDGRIWTGEYVLDFNTLLDPSSKWNLDASPENIDEDTDTDADADAPIFSASTGKFIHHRKFNRETEGQGVEVAEGVDALTLRTAENALQVMHNSAAGAYLQTERSWRGLEVREDEDAPSELELGRAGVARGYTLPGSLAGSESVTKQDSKSQ